MPGYCLIYHYGINFFFSGVLAPLNSADYLTGVSRKEKIFPLCGLSARPVAPTDGTGVLSEAGGEYYSSTDSS